MLHFNIIYSYYNINEINTSVREKHVLFLVNICLILTLLNV